MNKEIEYWKWKNTIIDFKNISDEKIDCNNWHTKKDWVFYYLGCPDEEIHEWYNGGFSSEYNRALEYAKELGLVEDYRDYEEEIYNLQQDLTDYKERNEKAVEYVKNNTRPEYRNGRDNEFYLELNQKELNELLEILEKKEVQDE